MNKSHHHRDLSLEEEITIERKEDLATIRTTEVFYPKSKQFFINFQDKEDGEEEEEENDENQKFKISKKELQNIFKMAGINKRQMHTYILYLLKIIKTEYIQSTPPDNNKKHKVDYNLIKNLINYFYIGIHKEEDNDDEEEDLKIHKYSLLKIFELINLSVKERLKLIEFYEIESDENSSDNSKDVFISQIDDFKTPPGYSQKSDKVKIRMT